MNATNKTISKLFLSTPSSEDLGLDHTPTSEIIDMICNLGVRRSQPSPGYGHLVLCKKMLRLILMKTQASSLRKEYLGQAFKVVWKAWSGHCQNAREDYLSDRSSYTSKKEYTGCKAWRDVSQSSI